MKVEATELYAKAAKLYVQFRVLFAHCLVVGGEFVDVNVICIQLRQNLGQIFHSRRAGFYGKEQNGKTFALKRFSSSLEVVSALAITGRMFTRLDNSFIVTTSKAFSLTSGNVRPVHKKILSKAPTHVQSVK